MTFLYSCQHCGEVELDHYGETICPSCGGKLRRIYSLLSIQVRRGWTDIPPESRYSNWSESEKKAARERGG